jgi:glycosyltransferase involved in cell wall biosynthesis
VVNQTVPPSEWVIVSDGSTDRTDAIVREAGVMHPWIRLVQLPVRQQRSFAAVVRAVEKGVASLQKKDYQYIGLLDSDLRFKRDYFEKVIEHFECNVQLGLAGGVVIDVDSPEQRLPRNRQDVPGAVQFFRRQCFEGLDGLLGIPEGGWDALTCARARMIGFETRLLTELIVDHLKPRNVSEGGLLRRQWQMGIRDYALGYHPLFELFKCLARMGQKPFFIGCIAWWMGYCSAAIQRRERFIPKELLNFVRGEQKRRLVRALIGS